MIWHPEKSLARYAPNTFEERLKFFRDMSDSHGIINAKAFTTGCKGRLELD